MLPRAATVAVLLALAAFTPASAQAPALALPHLGDASDMPVAAERRLGDRIVRELYRDPDYLDDPVIHDYVLAIWQPLMAAARLRGELPEQLESAFAWEILLGRDRTVNAFALPGGYLGVHLGLVALVSNRDELASVLAHELSHVTQRHIARSIARQSDMAPWVVGAMILGVLAASKDPASANAMVVGGQAAAAQTQLNYSRDMEREADRVGFGVMTQAGYAPQGFVSMFQKLQQTNRFNDFGAFPYLRSHPLTTERVADMQARVPDPADSQRGTPAAQPAVLAEHAMVAARARVLSNASVDALQRWAQEASPTALAPLPGPQQVGVLYGAALAAAKLRDYARAQSHLQALRQHPALAGATRLVRLLTAEVALLQEQPAQALAQLEGMDLQQRATLLLRARADLAAGKSAAISENLRVWVSAQPRDAQAWQLLARAYQQQGLPVAAVRAEAEASLAQLDYTGAASRFKAAQDISRKPGSAEHIEASIVDTRLRQVDALLREQALEK